MKEKNQHCTDTQTGLSYTLIGDYYLPNLIAPEGSPAVCGKYALQRRRYLKQHHRTMYINLLTTGTLGEHLAEIEQTVRERMELLTQQMAERENVTERLKAEDQMQWVGRMNNIRNRAEEIIREELIYI